MTLTGLLSRVRASLVTVRMLMNLRQVSTGRLLVMSAVIEWELGRRIEDRRDGVRKLASDLSDDDLALVARVLGGTSGSFHEKHVAHDWLRIVEAERQTRGA